MNKKILELAKESGFYVYNGLIFAETTSESMSAKMEKFAELIVKECANVAADHDALDIYEEIREHFEVEE